MIKIKYPKHKKIEEIKKFFIKKKLEFIVKASKGRLPGINDLSPSKAYKPDLRDLYNLYQYIVLNKRITILEFGSGWSSLIFLLAMSELKEKFSENIKKLRRNNPFELFILDNEKKFMNITKKRLSYFIAKKKLKKVPKINFFFSDVVMSDYNFHISTQYKKMPKCNPDFIYLDGPDQFKVKENINGININHKDLMPMSADILKIEYFLTPGTIIVVDGRAANAQFLKDNFRRKWQYKYDKKSDQHIFLLKAPLLGKYNRYQLQFYNKK